jgi:cardiolipin synthase
VKLLIQPGDSITPLVKAINGAQTSVDILIFRFNRGEIEKALIRAVQRGVEVHALIAYTNRGGEKHLRDLELRLLGAGVTVARTADDLVRYHGKMIIIDRSELYLLAFNFTYLDIEHSRSFGVVTRNRKFVQEAVKLFDADMKRQPYTPGLATFVVSPMNARKELTEFIKGAKRQLLIYDPKIADIAIIKLLEERVKAGVEVKIIGELSRKSSQLSARKLSKIRLHARMIVRDGLYAFIGSQSLRTVELDARREIGLIFREVQIADRLVKIFEEDWNSSEESRPGKEQDTPPLAKVAKRVAKAMTKELPPVAPVVEVIVKEVAGADVNVELDKNEVEQTVRDAVKDAIKQAVKGVVEEAVEQNRR